MNAEALDAFKLSFPNEPELVVLDWQHPVHRFNHHRAADITVPQDTDVHGPTVYPDGNYHAFMTVEYE